MKPFPRPPTKLPFPSPPTWRHVVANAIAILNAAEFLQPEIIRQDISARRFRIHRRYYRAA